MDQTTLARIGIILTTIGGFFIAPELIGLKRIEALRKLLLDISQQLFSKFSLAKEWASYDIMPRENFFIDESGNLVSYDDDMNKLFYVFFPNYASRIFVLLLLLVIAFPDIIELLIKLPLWVSFFLFGIIGPIMVYNGNTMKIRKRIVSYITSLPAAVLYLTGLPFYILLACVAFVFSVPFRFAVYLLAGRKRLQKFLIRSGVFMIITGTMLQFMAS